MVQLTQEILRQIQRIFWLKWFWWLQWWNDDVVEIFDDDADDFDNADDDDYDDCDADDDAVAVVKVGRACHKTNYRRTLPPQCVICAQITRIIQFCLVFVLFCLVFVLFSSLNRHTVHCANYQRSYTSSILALIYNVYDFALLWNAGPLVQTPFEWQFLLKRRTNMHNRTIADKNTHKTKNIAFYDVWCVHRCHRFCCKFVNNTLQCLSTILTDIVHIYIQKRSHKGNTELLEKEPPWKCMWVL